MHLIWIWYPIIGLLLGAISVSVHRSVRNNTKHITSLFFYRCDHPFILSFQTLTKLPYIFNCKICGESLTTHYTMMLITSLQFFLIANYAAQFQVPLFSIIALCTNFMTLNALKKIHLWENNMLGLLLVTAIIYSIGMKAPLPQYIIMPVIALLATYFLRYSTKWFTGSELLGPKEAILIVISFIMLNPISTSKYLILCAVFSFIWSLFIKITLKREHNSLLPAISWALLICLLFYNDNFTAS